MNGIRRWNADELIPGEVNFTVKEDQSGGYFFLKTIIKLLIIIFYRF